MIWRWPIIGREGGLGGRCFGRVVLVLTMSLIAKRKKRRVRDKYSKMATMFIFYDTELISDAL